MKTLTLCISLALLAASSHGATIAYWNATNAGQNSLVDLSSNGNDLTSTQPIFSNSSVELVTSIPNPDGTVVTDPSTNGSIYVNTLNPAPSINNTAFNMTTTNSFTFEGWIQAASGSSMRVIGGDRHQDNGYKGWYLNITSTNKLQFYANPGTAVGTITSTADVADGANHYFAAVWDHSNSLMSLYMDDTLVNSISYTSGSYTNVGFALGARDGGTGSNFDDDRLAVGSRLDEMRFSDQALSGSQLLNNVPEPGTALLLGLGLMLLLRRRRD